jgi:hypothetical protein
MANTSSQSSPPRSILAQGPLLVVPVHDQQTVAVEELLETGRDIDFHIADLGVPCDVGQIHDGFHVAGIDARVVLGPAENTGAHEAEFAGELLPEVDGRTETGRDLGERGVGIQVIGVVIPDVIEIQITVETH